MTKSQMGMRSAALTAVATAAVLATSGAAMAGGFAVREQSTVFMGSAFAGAAAGGALSSMYWNSAATAELPGFNSESAYTLILPDSEVTVTSVGGVPISPLNPFASSSDIGIDAVVGASYMSYQLSNELWFGLAMNSPFGLGTKPDNNNYLGAFLGRTTKFLTLNANPTLAYKIAPGVTIGAGVQIEWGRGKLQFALPGTNPSLPGPLSAQFKGDDWAFGATAGIMIEPAAGTTIGIGYRSRLNHNLDGTFRSFAATPSGPVAFALDASAEVNLPDIVTASFRQELSSNARLLGTVEWSNWSRFEKLALTPVGLTIDAHWSDGWFFSLGGEYDYTPGLTLRGGLAYEISPVDDPTKRFTTIPDSDRIWLNIGASYKYSEWTTIDVAYSHIFLKDEGFARHPATAATPFVGDVESDIDLISIGVRSKLDWLFDGRTMADAAPLK